MNGDDYNKKLLIWPNGKKADSCFEIYINHTINSLRRLKDCIVANLNNKIPSDKIKIYDYKEIEIDDADIAYLSNNQTLYVSLDGSNFSIMNYVNENEFVSWIKSGGYGKVYKARNVINGENVAIKKQDISTLNSEEIYNISREALYLQSFKHRNIVKFINSYVYENQFYTVMQCAVGGELNTYLEKEKYISEFEARRIFKQLHEAVKYIHSRNVVHRDLKPNNILFLDEKRENVVLIDFGISGTSRGNVKESIKAGTTKFIPPELASGLTFNSSTKIDIWAMGIILYLMLFGVFPFDAKNDGDIQYKIVKDPLKFPSNINISKTGYTLLNALLEKNQTLRVDTNDILFDDWYNDENVSEKVLIKEEPKQIQIEETPNILEEIKNIEEDINKYKLSKSIGMSQNKSNIKPSGFGTANSNFSSNYNSTANKKVAIKNFSSPTFESSKAESTVNKKFVSSKTRENLKSTLDSANSDLKGNKKK